MTESKEKVTPEPDRWHVRVRVGTANNKRGQIFRTKTATLAFGHLNRNGNLIGRSFHSIEGPTCEKSVSEFAEYANRMALKPEKLTRCVADGQKPKWTEGDTLDFGGQP